MAQEKEKEDKTAEEIKKETKASEDVSKDKNEKETTSKITSVGKTKEKTEGITKEAKPSDEEKAKEIKEVKIEAIDKEKATKIEEKTPEIQEQEKVAEVTKIEKPEEKKAIERVYTIPLSKVYNQPWSKRTRKATRIVREFLERHTKKEVKIASDVNEAIWSRGMKHPPRKIRVNVEIEGDIATARLLR